MTMMIFDMSYYVARGSMGKTTLTSPSGFPTGGIFFSLNMLGSDMNKFQPDYAVAVFDRNTKGEPQARNEIYAEYKANRKAITEEEKAAAVIKHKQRRVVREVLNLCGITATVSHKGWEADDTMASIAIRAADLGQRVLILTGDKDITQLVSSKIRVLDTKLSDGQAPIKDYWLDAMTPDRVLNRYGVMPEKIVELLALDGDAVDNVPGIKGITRETAAELLQEYGSIKAVCKAFQSKDSGLISNYRKCAQLGDQEFLKRNLSLVRLNTDLIDEFDLEDYRIDVPNDQQAKASKLLQSEFGFKDIPQGLLKYLASRSNTSSLKSRAALFD